MSIVNILDSAGAYTLDSANALDLLIAGDRRVVVTQDVVDEIGRNPNTQLKTRILNWIDASQAAGHVDVVPVSLTAEELANYSAKGDVADASIAKYIEQLSDPSQRFELVTDNLKDFDGRGNYKIPDRVILPNSTTGFVLGVIGDQRISETRALEVVGGLRNSNRLNNITDSHRTLPDDSAISKFYGDPTIRPGWVTDAALKGINTSVLFGVGFEVLRQFGILGDILSFGVTAAHAAELRSDGKEDEANRTWVRYIFETSGGVVGGALGAAIGFGLGGPLGALAGGIIVGYGVGEYGAEFGDYLFDNFKQVVEPGLADLNRLIDAALSEDEDVSRKFAEAVVQGLDLT